MTGLLRTLLEFECYYVQVPKIVLFDGVFSYTLLRNDQQKPWQELFE